jgi:DNA mismatch endonuclease (patch repair protein)
VTDVLTPEQRSRCMAAIRSKNTKPEIIVRRLLRSLGHGYRLHGKNLPGRPDIVLPGLRKVIFVHGCFWHRHRCRYGSVQPKTNAAFWIKKLQGNIQRDKTNRRELRRIKWQSLVVWECQTKKPEALLKKITRFLKSDHLPKISIP